MTQVSLIGGWSDTSLSLAPLQRLVDRLILQTSQRVELIKTLGGNSAPEIIALPAFRVNNTRADLHELEQFVTALIRRNEALKEQLITLEQANSDMSRLADETWN